MDGVELMTTGQQIEQALKNVTDQSSFINELLIYTLDWRFTDEIEQIEDIAYEWTLEDLDANDLDEKIVDGRVFQIPPLEDNPWGIFILEFKNPDIFLRGRGLTTPLRKVLRGLVPRRRRSSHLPAFNREELLFICTYNSKETNR